MIARAMMVTPFVLTILVAELSVNDLNVNKKIFVRKYIFIKQRNIHLGSPMKYIFATSTGIKKLSISFAFVDMLHEDTTVSRVDVNDITGNIYWTSG